MFRRIAGTVLFGTAFFVVLSGYARTPTRATCAVINSAQQQAGHAATCSTVPGAGYFIVAGLLAVAGLLCFAPWIARWIAGKKA